MKTWLLWFLSCAWLAAQGHLQLVIEHSWGDEKLSSEKSYTTDNGALVEMERLSYLVSGVQLKKEDGTWVGLKNRFWFVDGMKGDYSILLPKLAPDSYTALIFIIGVDSLTDRSDPNVYSANHALNPVLNQLHWSWSGGYIYAAIEGKYTLSKRDGGFSYHIARQSNKMAIEVPIELGLQQNKLIDLSFDLEKFFAGATPIVLGVKPDTTHSAVGDEWAKQLSLNVKAAWSLKQISQLEIQVSNENEREYKPYGTPYPLKIKSWMPRAALPERNFPSKEGVELGRLLFHDKRLSRTNTMSCVDCHAQSHGFTDSGKKLSMGVGGELGTRNSMPLLNLLWGKEFFWDGRANSVHAQAIMPIEDEKELDESLENVVMKLSQDPSMVERFNSAFGSEAINAERIGKALEQFLVTLIAQDSKFDRAMSGQEKAEPLTSLERRGMELFFTESDPRRGLKGADCFHCHGGSLFTNQAFMDNGLDTDPVDLGRFLVTGRERDKGRFKVPSLRNIELTAPYMHDGRFDTLEEVVRHYNTGVKRSPNLDPNLAKHRGLGLSLDDEAALVAFLKTLTEVDLKK